MSNQYYKLMRKGISQRLNELMSIPSPSCLNMHKEEVDEPSRYDLEEAVMIAASELSMDDLEYLIDLPNSSEDLLQETLECFDDDGLIDLHKQIEDYKHKKATKLLRQRNRRIKAIADAIFFVPGGVISQEDAFNYATTLAKKLKL